MHDCDGESINQQAEDSFHQQIEHKDNEHTSNVQLVMVLKFGHFGKYISNNRKVLKLSAGEG
jgi:hypothetical protein